MKPYQLYISILLVAFSLQSCKKKFHEPEGDQPKFTWKGTVYKALGDEVWRNATMTLIAEQQGLSGMNYTTVATGVSDENGKFELTYERFTTNTGRFNTDGSLNQNQKLGQLTLWGNGAELMIGPWNVDVDREFAGIDHSSIVLNIDKGSANVSEEDTLFIYSVFQPNTILKGNLKFVQFKTSVGIIERFQIIHPIADSTISFKFGFTGNVFNTKRDAFLNYAFGKKEMDRIFAGYYSEDDESEKENLENFTIRSFPYTDTVSFTLVNK